jgi:hypothetical protein
MLEAHDCPLPMTKALISNQAVLRAPCLPLKERELNIRLAPKGVKMFFNGEGNKLSIM